MIIYSGGPSSGRELDIWPLIIGGAIAIITSSLTLVIQRRFDERRQNSQNRMDMDRDYIKHKRRLLEATAIKINECASLLIRNLNKYENDYEHNLSEKEMEVFKNDISTAIVRMGEAEARVRLLGEERIAKQIKLLGAIFRSITRDPDNETAEARELRFRTLRLRIRKQRRSILTELSQVYVG